MSRLVAMAVASAVLLGVAGCGGGSSPATTSASKSAGQPAWDVAGTPYVAPGWKPGDKASWQEQMTKRAQNQNEYLRVK
jgi:hypothetical protein